MNNSFRRREPESQHPNFLLGGLHILKSSLTWLVNLIQLTEAEQENAGIYLDDPPTNEYQQSQYINNKEKYNDP